MSMHQGRGRVFLPGTGIDGVVLPLLAAANEEQDEAGGEIDVRGFFVDAAVLRAIAAEDYGRC
jgi:hypothetical protein